MQIIVAVGIKREEVIVYSAMENNQRVGWCVEAPHLSYGMSIMMLHGCGR